MEGQVRDELVRWVGKGLICQTEELILTKRFISQRDVT
jgi:hypothetical protein